MRGETKEGDWRRLGACRTVSLDVFFPVTEFGRSILTEKAYDVAKEVCRHCPVIEECLDYALSCGPELEGCFGGTSPTERRSIRRTRRRAG